MAPLESPFLGPGPRRTLEAALEFLVPVPELAPQVAGDIDAFLAQGDPVLGEQFQLALRVLEHLGGTGPFAFRRFSRLPVERRLEVFDAWRRSSLGLKRQIADAIRKTASFSWYVRPDAWPDIGYDGPWVQR